MSYQERLSAIGAEADAENVQQQQDWLALQAQYAGALATIDELTKTDPPPPPPPAKGMFVGSSLYTGTGETQQDGFARRTTEWGAEPEMVRYFYPGLPTGGWPVFGGAQVVASFKPPNLDVVGFNAGKYDAQVKAWLGTCPRDGRPKRVAVFHEREDDIERGAFTFAQALQMDAHMHQLLLGAAISPDMNLRFGLILMQWTLDSRSGRKISNYLPTGYTYDWMGWDPYPGNVAGCDLPGLTATKAAYKSCADATAAHGAKNWVICETGTSNKQNLSADEYDKQQAAWITGSCQVARDLGAKGYMYFDSTVGGDFRIKGPKAAAAIGAEIKAA